MPQKWQDPLLPQIAAFAYGEDYHSLLHRKLLQVLHTLKETYPHLEGRIAVDTSPLLERYWAVQAGLGYIGKNALLINPVVGSFVFIGIIALNQAADAYDMQLPQNACSRCRRCIEQCPARAILRPRVIDARRCISYRTQYGYKKHTDATSVAACGYIWGCDICQRVCPKNQNVHPKNNPEWQLHHKLISLTANDWRRMSAEEFALLTKDSTMKRADFNTIKMSL
jgi:epoxyqueuosine reductase